MIETKYESFEEYWMMGLRLCEGRPLIPPESFGGKVFVLNKNWLDIFVREGWLEFQDGALRTTLQGRLRLNAILLRLLDIPKKFPMAVRT